MSKIREITEGTHYQTFDFIGGYPKDSNSGEKYKLSKLENYNLSNKKILDIGCNAGYFLFRMVDKNPRKLVGIDTEIGYLNTAKSLNAEHFKSNNIDFICSDFFSYDFKEKFNLIICFSTFHYFVNKQEDFFDKCFDLLTYKGTLLLEVEEYPKNDYPTVNNDKRPGDGKRYNYPNELKIKELIYNKFRILDKYKSVNQNGSLYDRYFYKLHKYSCNTSRKIDYEVKKSVIMITGNPAVGKSSLCDSLLGDKGDKIDSVSLDMALIQTDHNIKEILDYVNVFKDDSIYHISEFCDNVLSNDKKKEFIDYFVENYIKSNRSSNIIVEGYLFKDSNIGNYFAEKCKQIDYRVWLMFRIA